MGVVKGSNLNISGSVTCGAITSSGNLLLNSFSIACGTINCCDINASSYTLTCDTVIANTFIAMAATNILNVGSDLQLNTNQIRNQVGQVSLSLDNTGGAYATFFDASAYIYTPAIRIPNSASSLSFLSGGGTIIASFDSAGNLSCGAINARSNSISCGAISATGNLAGNSLTLNGGYYGISPSGNVSCDMVTCDHSVSCSNLIVTNIQAPFNFVNSSGTYVGALDASGNSSCSGKLLATNAWRTIYSMTNTIGSTGTVSAPTGASWTTSGTAFTYSQRITASFYLTNETTLRFGAYVNIISGVACNLLLRLEIGAYASGVLQSVALSSYITIPYTTPGYNTIKYTLPTGNSYIVPNTSLYAVLSDGVNSAHAITYSLYMATIDIQ